MQEEGQKVERDERGGSGKEKGERGGAKREEGTMEKGQRVVGGVVRVDYMAYSKL